LLIVEDDLPLRTQLKILLQKHLKQIDEAPSFKEAKELITSCKYDLILLDLGLPPAQNTPSQGLALLEYLHQGEKVIVLTGQDSEEAVYKAIKDGVFDFLVKPVLPDVLLASLKRACLFLSTEQKIAQSQRSHRLELTFEEQKGIQSLKDEVEKKVLQKILQQTDFNIYQTAKRLGLQRQSIYYLLKKFNISRKKE